jgi:hypothetical protein
MTVVAAPAVSWMAAFSVYGRAAAIAGSSGRLEVALMRGTCQGGETSDLASRLCPATSTRGGDFGAGRRTVSAWCPEWCGNAQSSRRNVARKMAIASLWAEGRRRPRPNAVAARRPPDRPPPPAQTRGIQTNGHTVSR